MAFLVPLLQVAVVFAIFGAAMWFLKRHSSRTRGSAAQHVSVIATAPLGRTASVAVVRIGDKTFALGVTDAAVNNLGEVDLPAGTDPSSQTVAGTGALAAFDVPLSGGATSSASTTSPAGSATGPQSFWERFQAAAKAQGAAPASLVAGIGYVLRATKAARATSQPVGSFALTLAAATDQLDPAQAQGQGAGTPPPDDAQPVPGTQPIATSAVSAA